MTNTAVPESMSVLAADLMAHLTIAKFSDEQLLELATGDTYSDTVRALGFDPLREVIPDGSDTDQR